MDVLGKLVLAVSGGLLVGGFAVGVIANGVLTSGPSECHERVLILNTERAVGDCPTKTTAWIVDDGDTVIIRCTCDRASHDTSPHSSQHKQVEL